MIDCILLELPYEKTQSQSQFLSNFKLFASSLISSNYSLYIYSSSLFIDKMPMVLETISARKKQEVFENKLKEIENAISIFKKPKVFIARDD